MLLEEKQNYAHKMLFRSTRIFAISESVRYCSAHVGLKINTLLFKLINNFRILSILLGQPSTSLRSFQ